MNNNLKLIQPSGIFDHKNGAQLLQEVSDILGSITKTILIDFQCVTFMDSAGFSALLMTLKIVREQQGRLVLCSINDQIRLLLEISNTNKIFEVFPDQASFTQ